MRRLLGILVLAVALHGCASLQPSVTNPVTREMLYDVENSAIVVFAGLRAYKRSCVAQVIPQSCRDVIRKIQFYTRQLETQLPELRRFVRTNDQINAVTVYNLIRGLLANAKTEAASAGVM